MSNYVYDKKQLHDNAICQAYRTALRYPGVPIVCTGSSWNEENDGTGHYSIKYIEGVSGKPARFVVGRRPDKRTGNFRTVAAFEYFEPEDDFEGALERYIDSHQLAHRRR